MEHHITPSGRSRPRLLDALLATSTAVVGIAGFGASPAAGGGWALGSLDAMPAALAGETEQIGFTILQHGVTPAAVDGEVGIEFVGADGEVTFFDAAPDGEVGHYVATTTFPVAGDYEWNLRMGWFPDQDLGALTVTTGGDSSGGSPVWETARWAALAGAGVLAAIAIADLLVGRRRSLGLTR